MSDSVAPSRSLAAASHQPLSPQGKSIGSWKQQCKPSFLSIVALRGAAGDSGVAAVPWFYNNLSNR
uniref:Uncharacterized protein n=1 Tax=Oryza punctata TaxID=4537 RepID=A0A0E0KHJ5_ORYPU